MESLLLCLLCSYKTCVCRGIMARNKEKSFVAQQHSALPNSFFQGHRVYEMQGGRTIRL